MDSAKPKLLVVEDDIEISRFIQKFMKNHFDIKDCYSSETFYERLKEDKYDVILMDIALSGDKDGLQLTRELREMEEYKDTPIIAMTAHVFEKDKENAFKAGVNRFLAKPVPNHELRDTLLEVVGKKI
jgi:two-component system aerobic respiration control sensor histidine kinase ArcB